MKIFYFIIIFIIDLYYTKSIKEENRTEEINIKNITNKINDIINLDNEINDLIHQSNLALNDIIYKSRNISKQLNKMKKYTEKNTHYFMNLIIFIFIVILLGLLIYFILLKKEKSNTLDIYQTNKASNKSTKLYLSV